MEGVRFNANFNLPLEQSKNARQVAEAYHKAKSERYKNANPELVKAVEDLLGKPKAVTPNVEDWSKDVESTAKALESVDKNKLKLVTQKQIDILPISNKKSFNFLKQKQFGDDFANKALGEFSDKDGNRYYIRKKANQDIFEVFDANDLDNQVENGGAILPKNVAIAAFDTSKALGDNGYFSGFKESESIKVSPEYRRKGIATAITKFAEKTYNKPYRPTDLVSSEMKGFLSSYLPTPKCYFRSLPQSESGWQQP